MKKYLNLIKIIGLSAIFAVGVSYVSAASWSAPGTTPTAGNAVAAVNTSDYGQTKIGAFSTNSFLKAGSVFSSLNAAWNKPGYVVGEKAIISPWSFFTTAFLPGNASQVKIGSNNADTTDPFTGAITPFTIDLVGRGGYNTSGGRNMIDIRTDTNACYPNATIRTNTPSVALYNTDGSSYASPIVRGVQLSGGDPAPGKILVSTDANGNAIWATPVYDANTGKITFTYGASPVATGQSLCVNPVAGCTNPAATNYNPNATVDNGSCTLPQLGCTSIVPPPQSGLPVDPVTGIPPGYKRMPNGVCRPYQHWGCFTGLSQKWLPNEQVIGNPSNPNFHQPYCTSATYQPGDKYYRDGSFICADPGVTPDPTACSNTGTPVLQSCGNYSTLCRP